MIQISIHDSFDLTVITIQGHANYAPKGSDIVCSAISVLYQTLIKVLNTRTQTDYKVIDEQKDEQTLFIYEMEDKAYNAFKYFLTGCQLVSEAYPHHVELQSNVN